MIGTVDAARDQWMRRLGPFYPLLVAFQLQTDLPVARELRPDGEDIGRAAPWVIGVGALVGLGLAAVATLLLWTPLVPAIVAALLVALGVFTSGAFAERGLASAVVKGLGEVGSVGSGHLLAAVLVRLGLLLGTSTAAWTAALVVPLVVGKLALLVQVRPPWDLFTDEEEPEAGSGDAALAEGLGLGAWAVILAVALAASIAFAGGWGLLIAGLALGCGALGRRVAILERPAVVGLVEVIALVVIAASAPAEVSPLIAR